MTEKGDYMLEKMVVQDGILDLLRDLPYLPDFRSREMSGEWRSFIL